jgi:hypothetical protein
MSDEQKEKLAKQKALEQLPMDQASRMARAKDMGFDVDTPVYHGSPHSNIKEFIPSKTGMFGSAVYTTTDPNEAAEYARRNNMGETGKDTIYPLLTRGRILNRENYQDILDLYKEIDPTIPDIDLSGEWWKDPEKSKKWDEIYEKIDQKLKRLGKSTNIDSMVKDSKIFSGIQDKTGRIIFDPKNIRSTFAKFDPSKIDSSDISSFAPKTAGEKTIGAVAKGLGYLDKGLTKLGHLGTAADFMQGNIPEAALDVAETALAKTGSAGAARVLPFLELLRPTEMEPKDDVTSDIPMKPERFRKLKQLYNKEE